jgi:hypothetical protein
MALLDTLTWLTGDPEFKAQVMALVPPDRVPWVVIAIAIVTALARLRTARKGD